MGERRRSGELEARLARVRLAAREESGSHRREQPEDQTENELSDDGECEDDKCEDDEGGRTGRRGTLRTRTASHCSR